SDYLAHFPNGVADRSETGLCSSAAFDTGLDLGGDGPRFASELADGRGDLAGRSARVMSELLHLGGDDREAAPGIARPRCLDGRIQSQHVGLSSDRLDRRGYRLHLAHSGSEAGHSLAQLNDEVGQPLEAVDRAFDGLAARLEL